MLEPLFGNGTAEKVLLYLLVHRESYARELARAFSAPLSVLQKQLVRLERGGVLASTTKGRTKLFHLDADYAFARELTALLRRALALIPVADRAPFAPRGSRPKAAKRPRRPSREVPKREGKLEQYELFATRPRARP